MIDKNTKFKELFSQVFHINDFEADFDKITCVMCGTDDMDEATQENAKQDENTESETQSEA